MSASGSIPSPLLNDPHPLEKIRTLLAAREQFYKQADVLLNSDLHSAREVAQQVINQFRLVSPDPKMKEAIRQQARALGFDACRTTAGTGPSGPV